MVVTSHFIKKTDSFALALNCIVLLADDSRAKSHTYHIDNLAYTNSVCCQLSKIW